MSDKEYSSFYYVIPAEIMHAKDLDIYEKHLYALISGLANKHGYCFASNDWFETELGVGEKKIQRHLSTLETRGYITRQMVPYPNNPFKKQRRIFINAIFKKFLRGVSPDGLGGFPTDALGGSPQTGIISESNTLISEEKEKKKSAAPPPSADASDLCKFFIEKIKERNPKFKDPKVDKWTQEFECLLKQDSREYQDTRVLIEWIHTHSFWKSNILSPANLRKHYDKLLMQMQASKEQESSENNRLFALNLKKKYPDRLKNLTINPKYAMNLNAGKEIPFTLPEETFRNALCNMFGGKYEPNRQSGQRSDLADTEEGGTS
jgi:hypothetical protein